METIVFKRSYGDDFVWDSGMKELFGKRIPFAWLCEEELESFVGNLDGIETIAFTFDDPDWMLELRLEGNGLDWYITVNTEIVDFSVTVDRPLRSILADGKPRYVKVEKS